MDQPVRHRDCTAVGSVAGQRAQGRRAHRELRQRPGERVEAALNDNPADSSTVVLNNLRCAVQLANR
jgi:hypothetical protein